MAQNSLRGFNGFSCDFRTYCGNSNTMIYKIGSPILRQVCKEVPDSDFEEVAVKLLKEFNPETMYGLAAPQIGLPIRAFVYKSVLPVVIINPIITGKSDEIIMNEEGCLSIPKIKKVVPRASWVKVQFSRVLDIGSLKIGKMIQSTFHTDLSFVFQHEIDHLNGKLIIDY